MQNRTLEKHMRESIALKEQIEALMKEKDKHDEAIKAELTARGEEKYEHGGHKVTYKMVVSMRFDRDSFDKDHPGEYEKYRTKRCESPRYQIA